jgi:phosphoribosylformylglycinamidine synthase PurS subunit
MSILYLIRMAVINAGFSFLNAEQELECHSPGGSLDRRFRRSCRVVNMKARVYVSFKPTVLDPQGQTIRGALNSLGHSTIAAVRQGKFFDIEIAPGAAREQAQREMDQIARDVLANPVIEDYSIEFLD